MMLLGSGVGAAGAGAGQSERFRRNRAKVFSKAIDGPLFSSQ